ncbi:GDSL esterase/lipase 4 [Bienertia sinuspersici]
MRRTTTTKTKIRTNTRMFPATLLFIILISLSPSLSNAQRKTPLFVFGDSLYDNGMTFYGRKNMGAQDWPYGQTYFQRAVGRYSDGRVIPDFIAEYAGLPFLQPYFSPGLQDLTNGVNFASAGSCVLVELRPHTINLMRQIDYFKEMVQRLKQQVGVAEANKLLSEAVYMFNVAGNDYVNLFEKNVNKKRSLSNFKKKRRINMILGNLTVHIKTVYKLGGRKFAFQKVGPLGCLPSIKHMLSYKGACMPEPQELAKMHNTAFVALIKNLETQLPDFKYSIYDFYTSLHHRVLYGATYGFRESQTACCGSGAYNGDFTCQKKGSTFSVCSNPNDYLWFDSAHPTDRANQDFSYEFWSGGPDLVSPYNLQTLFAAN